MTAFLLVHTTIKDEAKFDAYAAKVPATLAPFGGEIVHRGNKAGVLEGESPHERVALATFPDLAALNGWWASDAYKALTETRREAADMTFVAYETPPG